MSCGKRTSILGVNVDIGCQLEDITRVIEDSLSKNSSGYICTTNPEFIMAAQKDPEFKAMINNAYLSLPDGSGVVMADYYLRKMSGISDRSLKKGLIGLVAGADTAYSSFVHKDRFAPKITGVSLTEEVFKMSDRKGYSIFILGGMPRSWRGQLVSGGEEISHKVAEVMRNKHPKVNIIGATSAFSYREEDDLPTLEYIHSCMKDKDVKHLDFILVAYGQKKQEAWLARNLPKIPCKIGVGIGGTLDYLSGVSKKPSDKIVKSNLEWLFRLCTQPWRFSRIFRAFPVFPYRVYKDSLR